MTPEAPGTDLVLLCFDTQNQQDREFRQVAERVTAYGQAAVAVLSCRTPLPAVDGRCSNGAVEETA